MTFVSVIILKDKRLCCVVLVMLVISYLLAAERERLAWSQCLAHRNMTDFTCLIAQSGAIAFPKQFVYPVRNFPRLCVLSVEHGSRLVGWSLLLL